MSKAEFDQFATTYRKLHEQNIAISGESPDYFADYKMRDFLAHVLRAGLPENGSYLDFGCGPGSSINPFRAHLPSATLTCADVSQASLAEASAAHGDLAVYELLEVEVGEAEPNEAFDGAFANCVFHHIPHAAHRDALGRLQRRLRRGGLLMIYEHNPLNPLTVRAVRTCPLDENAVLIQSWQWRRLLHEAGFVNVRVEFRVFFPAALKALRGLERHLRWLPLGAQYCVTARRP